MYFLFMRCDVTFHNPIQQFQFFDKYSRFNYELGRRETWSETVTRAVDFLKELSGGRLDEEIYVRIWNGVHSLQVMPSMRLLASAGAQARRQNTSLYNCSTVPIDAIDALVEIMLLSMNGSGVGFSVENKYVQRLPIVKPKQPYGFYHVVADSTEGWAKALKTSLESGYEGYEVTFDYSQVRPAGSVLKTKGGRASGAEPLKKLLYFIAETFDRARGRKLTSLELHDIACEVGSASISGGSRRTALISLFDRDDKLMLSAKSGDFHPRRWNANNSAVWDDDITETEHNHLFGQMLDGMNGEPGIFNRSAAERCKPQRRASAEWSTNPCGEIILRPKQLCNLSVVVARENDTPRSLREKVELATIIGTIQSMATNFPGMRYEWKENCEEERLLGVDITGQMDSPVVRQPEVQRNLKELAVFINQHYAKKLEINPSAAVTCVKPSGNSAQLLNCSSGLHARWSDYYIRNIRVFGKSPVADVLRESGVPMFPENGFTAEDTHTWVVPFPVASPSGAITRKNLSAIQQCEYWKQVKLNWTEHNPSVTITYKPEESGDLKDWVWENRGIIGGMSFLPHDNAAYQQMPYVEISKDEYHRRMSEFPVIDWSLLPKYEKEDMSTAAQEISCTSGGSCEIDYSPMSDGK